jgi:chorismate-pyruvate lyase
MPEPSASHSPGLSQLVSPLAQFYEASGEILPPFTLIEGQTVPEPYRRLLVHQDDMTPTLEAFHGGPVVLEVLSRRQSGDYYSREVILRMEDSGRPVEFGANRINLTLFSNEARAEILKEHKPLGHILADYRIEHTSRPSAFLRLASDRLINKVLGLHGAQVLYGRRNTLFDPQQRPLAEVVEILPNHPNK